MTITSKCNKRLLLEKAREDDELIDYAIAQAKEEIEFGLFNPNINPKNTPKNTDMRNTIKSKIGEKSIQRSSKDHREKVLAKILEDIGIDKDKFKA